MAEPKNKVFDTLNKINVNDKTEKKNGLTYLSWAWAWGELKKKFPDANYTVYENSQGWNYHTDGKTAWVKVGVTVDGQEHIEYLPIMDFKNKSILLNALTSYDVNKAIQRALTKAIARHGLGLYIYAGEDLPEEAPTMCAVAPLVCADCGGQITEHQGVSPDRIAEATRAKYGVQICMKCSAKRRAAAEKQAAPVPQVPQAEEEAEMPFTLE